MFFFITWCKVRKEYCGTHHELEERGRGMGGIKRNDEK
jgi:hypothetical protein